MWLNQYAEQEEQEPQREVHEIDPKAAKLIQESMYGNFGGRLATEAQEKGKAMLSGAIVGVLIAVYFKKSPLYFGIGGAV
jgi:hypothetical protein